MFGGHPLVRQTPEDCRLACTPIMPPMRTKTLAFGFLTLLILTACGDDRAAVETRSAQEQAAHQRAAAAAGQAYQDPAVGGSK